MLNFASLKTQLILATTCWHMDYWLYYAWWCFNLIAMHCYICTLIHCRLCFYRNVHGSVLLLSQPCWRHGQAVLCGGSGAKGRGESPRPLGEEGNRPADESGLLTLNCDITASAVKWTSCVTVNLQKYSVLKPLCVHYLCYSESQIS